jgi:hypothetical protein
MQELVALTHIHLRVVAASCYIKPFIADAVCFCVVVVVYMQCVFVGYEWFFIKIFDVSRIYIISCDIIITSYFTSSTYICLFISVVNCFVREGWPLVLAAGSLVTLGSCL